LSNFVSWIGELIGKFIAFTQEHPDFMIALGLIAGGMVAAGIAVTGVTTAVGLLTSAIGILLSPVVLLIAAIAALVGWLSTQEGGIAGALSRAATAAQQLAAIFLYGLLTAVNWIKARFDEFVNTIKNFWG
jgi:hypothetical protein